MIRFAKTADLDSVEAIYNKIHAKEKAGTLTVGWAEGIYPVRKTAEDALDAGTLYVLEEDGKIYASAILNQYQLPEYKMVTWKTPAEDSEVLVMHTLTVDPDQSGKGYAKQMISFYDKMAREAGCKVLRIDTQAKNVNARAMYKKLNFTEVGIVDTTIFNGISQIELVMLERPVL
ncbi:MAG: GNAT family N-acetyltransferase [Treponema sp.]|nr:GNAT family N-acetyltransferase [Treponema sp.]